MERVEVTSENMTRLSRLMHKSAMIKMGIERGSLEEKTFLGLAFAGEAGELANIIKKIWRDGATPELVEAAKKEIADNLIYLLHLCDAFETEPVQVIVDKLDELYNVRGAQWAEGARAEALEQQRRIRDGL